MSKLVVCDHPLIQEKLAILRDKLTAPDKFRRQMEEMGSLMGYEVLRGLKTKRTKVNTPLKSAPAAVVDQPIAFVAVLRAGLGMIPYCSRAEGHIGHITYHQRAVR